MNRITSQIHSGYKGSRQDWQTKMNSWTITLRYQGRQFTFPFYTGDAIGEPTTFDAAWCVLSDGRGFKNSQGFEGWAQDYGFDTDSRAAEKLYDKCGETCVRLIQLLGEDWDDFMSMEEHELQRRCK